MKFKDFEIKTIDKIKVTCQHCLSKISFGEECFACINKYLDYKKKEYFKEKELEEEKKEKK